MNWTVILAILKVLVFILETILRLLGYLAAGISIVANLLSIKAEEIEEREE